MFSQDFIALKGEPDRFSILNFPPNLLYLLWLTCYEMNRGVFIRGNGSFAKSIVPS